METNRRELLDLLKSLRGERVYPKTDPRLPPCPLCGAPALAGYRFERPGQIEHDCDCSYLKPERYQGALMGAWRRWIAPRLLIGDLAGYPRYQEMLERPLDIHTGNQAAVETARTYSGGLLYIWGPPGTGKTHMVLRLALRMAEEGRFVRFRSELDFLAEERLAAVGETSLPQYERLVLDDAGKSRLSPFSAERLYALVERASTGAYDLIITSNLPPEALGRRLGEIGAAVGSRLLGGVVLEVEGPDQRRR